MTTPRTTRHRPPPDIVPFTDLFSSCPTPRVKTAERWDNYWYGERIGRLPVGWHTHPQERRSSTEQSFPLLRIDEQMSPEAALDLLARNDKYRLRRLSALATVGMWRVLSAEQIAAFVGAPELIGHANDLRATLRAGLTDRGYLARQGRRYPPIAYRHYYSPLPGRRLTEFLDSLPYPEWVAVTAGYPLRRSPKPERRHVAAAELALRVAEFCDVGSVVGESLSKAALLGSGIVTRPRSELRADLTIIRRDGLRIAVELLSGRNKDVRKQVSDWLRTLADTDPRREPLIVVFVDASPREKAGPDTLIDLRKLVRNAVHARGDARRQHLYKRVAVGSWRTWFPLPGCGSAAFVDLSCARPTGPRGRYLWEPAALLNPTDVANPATDPARAALVLHQLNSVYGTPHWLHDRSAGPDFATIAMQQAGYTHGPRLPKIQRPAPQTRRTER